MAAELGWSILSQVASWAQEAARAARTRRQERFANLVEHTGVIVAGVRRLNAEARSILQPLMWFEPDSWSRSQREAAVNRLLRFVEDDTVVPRMRTSVAALKELWPTVDDRDTQLILRSIVSAADALWVYDERLGPDQIVFLAALYGPDDVVRSNLRDLIPLIRKAQNEEEAARLRRLAEWLLDDKRGTHEGALAPAVAQFDEQFGRLLAQQNRLFPALPSPAWVWS